MCGEGVGWRAMDRPGKLTELKFKSHQRLDKMVVCRECWGVWGGRRGRGRGVCVCGGGMGDGGRWTGQES